MKKFTLIIKGREYIVEMKTMNKSDRQIERHLDSIAMDIMNNNF